MKHTIEYRLISSHYGPTRTMRSQVPLINHINEGLVILNTICASDSAKRAFCMHPMFQNDADLTENYYLHHFLDPYVMLLTMEYRSVANEYLSDKVGDGHTIRLSPLKDVNDMLVADKVQNYKDFITYHKYTHHRSEELDLYFNQWLNRLEVDHETYHALCKVIEEDKNEQRKTVDGIL